MKLQRVLARVTRCLRDDYWHPLWGYLRLVSTHFYEDRCLQTASALTFSTLLSLVPLIAVIFSVLSVWPAFQALGQQALDYVFIHFVPATGEVVQGYLEEFVAQSARLTGLGSLFLLFTALLILLTVQQAFNVIWRVKTDSTHRGWLSLLWYWVILTLSPLLLGVGIAASEMLRRWLVQIDWEGTVWWGGVLELLPMVCTWVGFSVLYYLVPNCQVKLGHALLGGLVAALLFELARWGFTTYIDYFPNYQVIYGALAAIPLFLLWLYLSWLVVLIGAEVTQALRYPQQREDYEAL